MGLNIYVVLGSAVVGLLVGLTGAGGGALMTPMLILLFSVKPAAAISSDLVAAVVMRPVGAAVHLHKGTVNLRLVGLMSLGSVPMAFLGAFLLKEMGSRSPDQKNVEIALGAALLIGAGAMVLRYILDRRSPRARTGKIAEVTVRPVPTILIGMVGGLIVGITSVGSGSLMIILLLFTYPMLSAGKLVGTDLTQAVPLTAAAALGALTFGHVEFGVTAFDHCRQRARGADRLAAVVPRAGPLHQAGHHLRDLRVRPEIRRRPHLPAGLDHGRRAAGRRGVLAGHQAPLAQGPGTGRDAGQRPAGPAGPGRPGWPRRSGRGPDGQLNRAKPGR